MPRKEQWKWVVGYKGYYQISNLGRVRSVDRVVCHKYGGLAKRKGQIRSLTTSDKYDHLAVSLWAGGVRQTNKVHKLVAAAFIGPCPKGMEVCHGPNGVSDNSVGNLLYGTRSENGLDMRRDGTHNGRAVRRSDGVEFISMMVAAEETDCHPQNICQVCKGKQNTTGGFGWEYI